MLKFVLVVASLFLSQASFANWENIRELVRAADKSPSVEKQREILERAYTLAKASVKDNPNVSNEHLWLANVAGRLGELSGIKEKMALSKVVKANAVKALALDPRNGPAYMTLGAWHFNMRNLNILERLVARLFPGGLPASSYEQAVAYQTKALECGIENRAEVYFIRGFAYAELEQMPDAKRDLRQCIAATALNEKERKLQLHAKEWLTN